MESYPQDSPADMACQIPYAQATFSQRALALVSVQEELKYHFPLLPWLSWARELDALQPDLWVEVHSVTLDYADLVKLTQQLARAPEMPSLDPPIYGLNSLYLARRLSEYAHQAVLALAELEENPFAYGLHTSAIITKLAAGNGVVEDFMQVLTGSRTMETEPGKSLPAEQVPGCPAVTERLSELYRIRTKQTKRRNGTKKGG